MRTIELAEANVKDEPEAYVTAGYRSGWEAACIFIAEGLEQSFGPPDLVKIIREASTNPPPLTVTFKKV